MREELAVLKSFLFAKLYRHPQVEAQRSLAQRILQELFDHYLHKGPEENEELATPQACADYLAGMTDRFAIRAHEQLTGLRLFDGAH